MNLQLLKLDCISKCHVQIMVYSVFGGLSAFQVTNSKRDALLLCVFSHQILEKWI